ncbi:MAG: winged helix-turn-helix domain-containing protein [Candidatus Methanoperedens sp.]|jgi:predicted transcriptional regulator|nr:winged helix-turn-helix domain-containing protein [Candidatus Methanoperedens sp.]MCZ7399497.1 winged helix-turn-helix domain-containing protein [Candidatus Methanoperedens sp.]
MNDWDLISFVKSSDKRLRILSMLKNSVSTPSDISLKLSIPISHVSSTLSELMENKIVICLTPERRKTKLYKITEKGVKVLSKIDEITGGNIGDE